MARSVDLQPAENSWIEKPETEKSQLTAHPAYAGFHPATQIRGTHKEL
jgi:hypothetical protein